MGCMNVKRCQFQQPTEEGYIYAELHPGRRGRGVVLLLFKEPGYYALSLQYETEEEVLESVLEWYGVRPEDWEETDQPPYWYPEPEYIVELRKALQNQPQEGELIYRLVMLEPGQELGNVFVLLLEELGCEQHVAMRAVFCAEPAVIRSSVPETHAAAIKSALEAAGARVKLELDY